MAVKRSRTRGTGAAFFSMDDEFADTLGAIRKSYGPKSFRPASENVQPERISSGVFILDLALLGGIPHNRVTMILGERHAGKSMLSDKIIASAQQQYPGSKVVKIDVEGTHDTTWSATLGVDTDSLYVFHPETGEQAVDATEALVRTAGVSVVVVDSIAALTPMKELDSSAEDMLVGQQARLVSSMVRKVTSALIAERNRGHYVTVVFINQFRSKVGVVYGDPRSIPGGKALEYSTSVQIIIKNKEQMGKDVYDVDSVVVNEHSFEIKKNKLNSGPRTGEFQLIRVLDEKTGLGPGAVDDASTMLAYAKKFGAYHGGGSSWTLEFWNTSLKFKGVADATRALYEDPELYWSLRNFLIHEQAEHLGMPEEFLERFRD